MNLVPVDTDPFAAAAPTLVPVEHDPFAQPAAANPFNRQVGADVSYGAPLGPAPPNPNQTDLAGEARAAIGGPITDRMASAFQTYAPQILGGTGQNYSTNLDVNRRETGEAQAAHPADAMAGNIAGSLPYLAVPGVGELGAGGGIASRIAGGAATGAALGGVQGAAGSPDWSDVGQTARDAGKGALLGGAVGGAVPAIGAGIGRAVTPFEISPERQALVAALRESGMNPTAGQATGSQGLQKIEAGIGDIPFAGGGADAARAGNNRAFTGALMEKAGAAPGTDASPASLNAAHEALLVCPKGFRDRRIEAGRARRRSQGYGCGAIRRGIRG